MKFSKRGTLSTLLAGVGVALIATLVSPFTALANSGGDGDDGNMSGSSIWRVAYGEPGVAYQQFRAEWHPSISVINGSIHNWAGNDTGLSDQICRNSYAIWWVQFNPTGRFDGGGPGYWIDNRTPVDHFLSRTEVPLSLRSKAAAWAGHNGYNSQQTVAVCSGSFQNEEGTDTGREWVETSDIETYSGDASWATSVIPEVTELRNGELFDPIGENNMNAQPAVTKVTHFGELINGIETGNVSKNDYLALKNAAVNALEADRTNEHPKVVLNAGNKAGLAEGGVLSIYEHTAHQSIELNATERYYWDWRCNWVREYNVNTGSYGPKTYTGCPQPRPTTTPTFDNAQGWTLSNGNYHREKLLRTQQNTGFWQILAVHCNAAEFNAVRDAIEGEQLIGQAPGVNEKSTGVLHTRHYVDRGEATAAGELLGSNMSYLPAAVSRTGELGFYDKECDLTCVAYPDSATGASAANGALNNVDGLTNVDGSSYKGGALFNSETNSNFLEIFRDNENRRVELNVTYPSNADSQFKYGGDYVTPNGDTITIPAHTPISTTITRWALGTPSTIMSNGGQFTITAVNGADRKALFTPSVNAPTTQTNFGRNTYSSANSTTLAGFYRSFDVKATWASEANMPQVLNVKWEYQPTVWTTFPTALGFSNSNVGSFEFDAIEFHDQPVDGRCYAQFGSHGIDLGIESRIAASTGSGTVNTLDADLLEGANGDLSYEADTNLVLKFVRAVSE